MDTQTACAGWALLIVIIACIIVYWIGLARLGIFAVRKVVEGLHIMRGIGSELSRKYGRREDG